MNKGGNTGFYISRPLQGMGDFLYVKTDLRAWQQRRNGGSMQVYEELVARGLIAQVTNEEEIRDMVNNGKATFYIGFDRSEEHTSELQSQR